jgi:Sec-independent protein translocase protein TatA
MHTIGPMQVVMLGLVALLVVGPKRLPGAARSLRLG